MIQLLLEGVNPEPWTSPKVAVFRGKPRFYKEANLQAFQEAMKELTEEALTAAGYKLPVFEAHTLLTVRFAFWRQTDSSSTGGRRSSRNQADATNMLKAAEDSLQGILYANDRDNRQVIGEVRAFGPDIEPAVLVEASRYDGPDPYKDSERRIVQADGNRFGEVVIHDDMGHLRVM